jgi:hypothetical protein
MQRVSFAIMLALFVWTANCPGQQSSGAKTSVTTGTITGRVVNSSGEPLAGASIYASALSGNARRANVTTDSHGDFKIDGLEPGLYAIFATLPGYISVQRATGDAPNYYRLGDAVNITMSKGGVITGTVTGPNGPLVGVGVFATRVRDADEKKLSVSFPGGFERRTDDRGMFRMYGLPPGAYIIMATRPRLGTILPSAYDFDVPTFYPSGTRDTAAEIVLREGDEITADIQYRGEPGHAISGKISGVVADDQLRFISGPQITLTDLRDRTPIMNSPTSLTDNSAFAIYGLPDGEYELSAEQYLPSRDQLRSPPQHLTVRGADVTGINVKLEPLASIAGRIVFENDPKATCGKRKQSATPETLVYARTVEPAKKNEGKADQSQMSPWPAPYSGSAAADAKGSFMVRSLVPGTYRIDPRLSASGWYTRSISFGPVPTGAARTNRLTTTRDDISVRNGERVTGVTLTITEGAGLIRGRVSAGESKTLPTRMRVYLVPADPEASGNVYRFYDTGAETEGNFTLDNVAPGKYWIMARRTEENESGAVKLIRQDEALRAKVLQEAEVLKKAVALKPCEQAGDFDLPYSLPPR